MSDVNGGVRNRSIYTIVISTIIGIITIIINVSIYTHNLQKEAIDDVRVQLARCQNDRDKYSRDYYTILESLINKTRNKDLQ